MTLSRWPLSDEVLLQFEQADPQLEYLLRAECLLRPGGTWLFRIASDGLGYEARGLRVRPGGRYVLVSTTGPVGSRGHERSANIACEGVHGALLELPEALTPEWEETLRLLGVTQAKSIEVWPAGLAAVVWDGEGHAEWLTSERPCLAVRSDHSIGALLVSMGSGPELSLELEAVPPGETVFIELPPLPVGLHRVSVGARTGQSAEAEHIGDLEVVMRIREARPWSPGVSPHGPLSVELEPTAPTLEQLWEGRVEIRVRGPVGRPIGCRVSMFERTGDPATLIRQLPPVNLPLTCEQLRRHLDKHLRESREAQEAYDDVRVCEIEFSAEELGVFTLRCEREFTPLRWTVRRVGHGHVARLHEDTGSDDVPVVSRVLFEQPTVIQPIEAREEYAVPNDGGLYVARLGDFTSAVILPPAVRGLRDFRCDPRINVRERSVETLLRTVGFARLWGLAKLPGDPFSATRQRDVLYAITSHIFRVLGGDNWGDAEAAARARPNGFLDLMRCVSNYPERAAIAVSLAHDDDSLASADMDARVECIAALLSEFLHPPIRTAVARSLRKDGDRPPLPHADIVGPDNTLWLVEFALRLASDSARVEAWAGEHLTNGVERLLSLPALARAARFAVLASDHRLGSRTGAGELYAGWRWS